MKILLHTCCADCLLKMAESLKDETAEITAYFYNPNIHPRSEYLSRLKAVKQIAEENKIKLVAADWSPREYFKSLSPAIAGVSPFDERETLKQQNPPVDKSTSSLNPPTALQSWRASKAGRCIDCWELRLRKSFEYAKENNFETVLTTLLSSHYQDKDKIKKIGKDLEKEFGIKFLVPKKISRDLKTTGFYKQNYCGCCYSLVEAWGEKFRL